MTKTKLKMPIIIIHLLFLPFLPLNLTVLAVLWMLRQITGLYLKLKLSEQFGGLLAAADRPYVPFDRCSRKVPMMVSFVKSDTKLDVLETIKQRLKEFIFTHGDEHIKLTSVIRTAFGQDYLLKNQIKVTDIVREIPLPLKEEEIFDEEYLKRLVGRIVNSPMPKCDKSLMEIFVATDPLVINTTNSGYVYPVILRFHHSVCDGIRLISFIKTMFSPKFEFNYSNKLEISKRKSLVDFLGQIAIAVWSWINCAVFGPGFFVHHIFFNNPDESLIHGPKLTGEKLVAWSINDNSQNVTTVRNIKNRIPGTRFSDVVFTCFSASLFNYFQKKNAVVPNEICCLVPIVNLSNINSAKVKLENDYALGVLHLPIIDSANFIKSLEQVKIAMNKLRNISRIQTLYLLLNYVTAVLPGPFIRLVQNTGGYSCIFSCVPGLSRVKVFGNCDVIANVGIAPHTNRTGVTFTIITYDDKFHVSLHVDKALISDQEEVQSIVDDVLQNVDLIDKCSKDV